MRTRAVAAIVGVVLALLDPVAGLHGRADPVGCASFVAQEDAQAVLAADPSDRFGLDPDGDGVACDGLPHRAGSGAPPTPGPTAAPVAFADPVAADVDGFWRRAFAKHDLPYAPPTAFAPADPAAPTACGLPGTAPAFYCPLDGAIAYDPAAFADRDDGGYGHALWVVMVAHEWGHRAQDQLGLLGDDGTAGATAFPMALELQAQCVAGAYVRDALRRHALKQIEADRADLVARTFLGDGVHGTSALQADAYARGRTKGLAGCGVEW